MKANSLTIAKFCAEEVERQGDSPVMVYHLMNAWYAAIWTDNMSCQIIKELGRLVCPGLNKDGFRKNNVQIGDILCPDWRSVGFLMDGFVQHIPFMEPWEVYKAFEEIHPFRDGNGRVGKILFNFINKTLDDPIMPPNLWNIANP